MEQIAHHKGPFDGWEVKPIAGGRGWTATQIGVCSKQVVRLVSATGREQFLCKHCSWRSMCKGILRPLDHAIHPTNPTLEGVKEALEKEGLPITVAKQRALKAYRDTGHRTRACVAPQATRSEQEFLASEGVNAAILWKQLLSVEVEKAAPEPAQKRSADARTFKVEIDEAEAKRRHILAVVATDSSFESASHPAFESFLQYMNPQYQAPKRQHARDIAVALGGEVAKIVEDRLRRRGPWTLITDGATSRGHGFINVLAHSCRGEVMLLADKAFEADSATGERIADILWPWVQNFPSVIGLQADNASNMGAAGKALARRAGEETRGRSFLTAGCLEHGAQLICGDILKIYAWLKLSTDKAHKAQKVLKRRKCLGSKVMRAGGGVFKLIRRTRHNSIASSAAAFLKLQPSAQEVQSTPAWKACFEKGGLKAKKAQEAVRAWTEKATIARVRRSLPLLQAMASLSKIWASAKAPEAWAVWDTWHPRFLTLAKHVDFRDHVKKESDGAVEQRTEQLRNALQERQAKHLGDIYLGAGAFDPRHLSSDIYLARPRWWQESVSYCANFLLPAMFQDIEAKQVAEELQLYVAKDGPFANIPFPDASAGKAEVVAWWDCRQPKALLREAALRMWSIPCSQGCSERAWASRGRKACPIRSRLKPETINALQLVTSNQHLLGVPCTAARAKKQQEGGMHELLWKWGQTLDNQASKSAEAKTKPGTGPWADDSGSASSDEDTSSSGSSSTSDSD